MNSSPDTDFARAYGCESDNSRHITVPAVHEKDMKDIWLCEITCNARQWIGAAHNDFLKLHKIVSTKFTLDMMIERSKKFQIQGYIRKGFALVKFDEIVSGTSPFHRVFLTLCTFQYIQQTVLLPDFVYIPVHPADSATTRLCVHPSTSSRQCYYQAVDTSCVHVMVHI
jgi:hypothetical protein